MIEEYIKLKDAIKQLRNPADAKNLELLKVEFIDIDHIKNEHETLADVQYKLEKANKTINELQAINAEYAWRNSDLEKETERVQEFQRSNENLKRRVDKLEIEKSLLRELLQNTIIDFAEFMREA